MTAELLAGAGRTTITGTGHYGLGGAARRKARGVHDDIFARCVAFSDGRIAAAFLALDVHGVPADLAHAIRIEVQRRITSEQLYLMVAATGILSGPDVLGEGRGCPEAYRRFLIDGAAATVVCALQTKEPAVIRSASVEPPAVLYGAERPTPPPVLALSVERPAATAETGSPPAVLESDDAGLPTPSCIATVLVLPCRPDVLGRRNTQVSCDYLGPLHTAIELARGGMSLALPGAVGDLSACPEAIRAAADRFAATRSVADALATPVLVALSRARPYATPYLDVQTLQAVLRPAHTWPGRRAWWRSVLGGAQGRIRAHVHAVRIGDCQLLTVPGAPTAAAAAEVRARMTTPAGGLVGCVNGMLGVLAPPTAPPPDAGAWPRVVAESGWPVLRDTLPVL